MDVKASMKLQKGGLWDALQARAKALQIEGVAQHLMCGVQKLRNEAAELRAALRRSLQP